MIIESSRRRACGHANAKASECAIDDTITNTRARGRGFGDVSNPIGAEGEGRGLKQRGGGDIVRIKSGFPIRQAEGVEAFGAEGLFEEVAVGAVPGEEGTVPMDVRCVKLVDVDEVIVAGFREGEGGFVFGGEGHKAFNG